MIPKLLNLIALVATLIKTDPEDYDEINAQVEQYNAAKADLKTFHGDSEMAQSEVLAALDDVVKEARVATPGDESLLEEQHEAAAEKKEDSDGDETAETLVQENTREQLVARAETEGVDIEGATTKADIAARIVGARS